MQILHIKPSHLATNPFQPSRRIAAPGLKALIASIKEHGVLVPVILDQNKVVLDGHRRIQAAISLGLDAVPCVVHDELTALDIGEINQPIKAFGSAGWMEAFVRSKGEVKAMPRAHRKRCETLLDIFGSFAELDSHFVSRGQGSHVLTYLEQLVNLFAVNGVADAPSAKQIGVWMLEHNLSFVCRELIKDLLKGRANTKARIRRLAKRIHQNKTIDREF